MRKAVGVCVMPFGSSDFLSTSFATAAKSQCEWVLVIAVVDILPELYANGEREAEDQSASPRGVELPSGSLSSTLMTKVLPSAAG